MVHGINVILHLLHPVATPIVRGATAAAAGNGEHCTAYSSCH